MNYKQINENASYWGLIATGLLIVFFILYLIYLIWIKKIRLSYDTILSLLLLFIIAIGIHSLQHEGQAKL